MRIISVCNQKGGVGKTTTAWAILTGAALRGRRALGIDFDPQGSLTYIMDAQTGIGLQHTAAGDIIPSSLEILTVSDVDELNHDITQKFRQHYDIIVIDAPPALGRPLLSVLRASTEVLIPLQADPLSMQGLYQMRTSIDKANPALKVTGAFFARHNSRSALARDMGDAIRDRCAALNMPFLKTSIREGVSIREAQLLHKPIFTYAPRSNQAKDYSAFLDEIGI